MQCFRGKHSQKKTRAWRNGCFPEARDAAPEYPVKRSETILRPGKNARPPELLYSVYSAIASTAICGLPGSFTVTRPEAPVCTRVRVISQVSITSMA